MRLGPLSMRIGLLAALLAFPACRSAQPIVPMPANSMVMGLVSGQPQEPSEKWSIDEWVERIQAATEAELPALMQPGYERYVVEMRAFRPLSAERVAVAMHIRAQAPWSAMGVASAQRRGGNTAGAVEVLEEQIARTTAKAEKVALWEALSLAMHAHGNADGRLDALGSAYAQGGADARQILGGKALLEERYAEALTLFGGLLDRARLQERDPEPWALPGWGLALLETIAPPEPPPEPEEDEDSEDEDSEGDDAERESEESSGL